MLIAVFDMTFLSWGRFSFPEETAADSLILVLVNLVLVNPVLDAQAPASCAAGPACRTKLLLPQSLLHLIPE
jgi:hypothetical protein